MPDWINLLKSDKLGIVKKREINHLWVRWSGTNFEEKVKAGDIQPISYSEKDPAGIGGKNNRIQRLKYNQQKKQLEIEIYQNKRRITKQFDYTKLTASPSFGRANIKRP